MIMTTRIRVHIRRCLICGTCHWNNPVPEAPTRNETADPAPTGPTAKVDTKAATPSDGDYTRGIDPAIIRCGKPAHVAVGRLIVDALTLDELECWQGTSLALIARLNPLERLRLARAAAFSLDPEDRAALVDELQASVTGAPPLFGPHDDLDLWADGASRNEKVACMKKCFDRLCRRDQEKTAAYFAERVAA